LARGRREIAAALAIWDDPVELLAFAGDGRECFAEGRLGAASFAASLQLDAGGAIERVLWLTSAAVEPSPTWSDSAGSPSGAGPVLDRYFAHLQAAEFAAAASCFTADCLYFHPPYAGSPARVAFRDREELLDGFENKRGPSPARPVVTALAQSGADAFIEGIVEDVPNGGTFLSSVSLARDGLICRYAAWYCAPRVPRDISPAG
jgi:hypothetical protein